MLSCMMIKTEPLYQRGRRGELLLRCHAGCKFEDIIAALSLVFLARRGDYFGPSLG